MDADRGRRDEPFFDRLQELQPDIDVVILTPESDADDDDRD